MPRLVIGFLLICFPYFASGQTAPYLKYSEKISEENLSEYLHVLASDSLEGRETGQPGLQKAARYIARKFSTFGIPPLQTTGTYFQEYPLEIMHPNHGEISFDSRSYKFLKDFYYLPGIQDTLLLNEKFVFLGYGIDSKNYSDYRANIDLKNKIVLILSGEPCDRDGNSLVTRTKTMSEWSVNWKKKLTYLKTFHPAAIFVVAEHIRKNFINERIKISTPTLKSLNLSPDYVPYFYISKRLANSLIVDSRATIRTIKRRISRDTASINSFQFSKNIQIKIKRESTKQLGYNVLGYVEGSDLKEEVVIVSAHIDHLGRNATSTYYGADDNASGSSALIEMARVFANAKAEGTTCRKSILFIGFSGEEKGLLGSQYYVSHPALALHKTTADLNIDMMGRRDEKHINDSDYIYLIGSEKNSRELYTLNESINTKFIHLKLDYSFNKSDDPNRFFYRSDQYNFARLNIPVLFYFNGIHKDYHKPSDTADKIDYPLLKKRTKLVFMTAWVLANTEEKILINSLKNK